MTKTETRCRLLALTVAGLEYEIAKARAANDAERISLLLLAIQRVAALVPFDDMDGRDRLDPMASDFIDSIRNAVNAALETRSH